ncbi:hypothetical protein B4088_3933 [Bacillus cereus]|uniref:Uncharacterized protein n=1 Tax=Bacillus cereus TaxID=1396 RepID=A0A164MNP2_BACCE|nr:hypothetical protein B4088_3933 [Bacillus cereus]
MYASVVVASSSNMRGSIVTAPVVKIAKLMIDKKNVSILE